MNNKNDSHSSPSDPNRAAQKTTSDRMEASERSRTSRVKRRFDLPQQTAAPVQLPAFRELEVLMKVIADEEVDFADFCISLESVPHVSKLIFRDARSIRAGRTNRIESLRHAVAMLGLSRIRAILDRLAQPYLISKARQEQEITESEEVARVSA